MKDGYELKKMLELAKVEADKLQARVEELKKENEQLRRYPDESHRILKALLMAGHSVSFEPFPVEYSSIYGQQFRINVRTPDLLKFQAYMPLEPYMGDGFNRSDGFAFAIQNGLQKVWDGVWR